MFGDWFKTLLAILVSALALCSGTTVMAQAPAAACAMTLAPDETVRDLVAREIGWSCNPRAFPTGDRLAVRLLVDPSGTGEATPDHLSLRRFAFDRLEVLALGPDGAQASAVLTSDDLAPGRNLMDASLHLPQPEGGITTLIMTVEGAMRADQLAQAQPVTGPPFVPLAGVEHILAAMLCGLLLAPIFFDLGFYRTLRTPFPLYHGWFCLLAFVQTAIYSGMALFLTEIPVATQRIASILSFDLMVSVSSLFILSFAESGTFRRPQRRLLYGMALGTALLGCLGAFGPPLLGPATRVFYYAGYLAYLGSLAYIVTHALRRGSRAIRYILLAHTPLLIVGLSRIVEALAGISIPLLSSYWAQNLALVFEVVITAYAVADRFLTLKRERDSALSTARTMEELTERDALTGLYNRRALTARFAMLHAEGYTTLAVIDLDHFKKVNDRYGHAIGDMVLNAVARALQPDDENALSFRMGGEEFVLLLRGRDSLERAERGRRMIAQCIAEDRLLDEAVTASMGVVDAPDDALPDLSFEAIYERADRLLYEAKAAGRNRTMSERLKVFRPRRLVERRAAA